MSRRALSVLGAVVLTATVAVTPGVASPPNQPTHALATSSTAAVWVERLAGPDRYATAAEIAKKWTAPVDHLYVVNGSSFHDAFIAAARAGVQDAPVLLTDARSIPQATAQQLTRLKPQTITVVGGTSGVSNHVLSQLEDFAGSGGVERVAATNRYTRSALMAERYAPGSQRVFLASGEDYPDALSAAAIAGTNHEPLMLTKRTKLYPEVAAQLARIKPREIVVIGGSDAVSDSVLAQVAAYATSGKATRISGTDRYETAAAVAKEFPSPVATAFVASGENHPDALAVSALAARQETAVVLTRSEKVTAGTLDALAHLAPSQIYVAGGQAAVSDSVLDVLRGGLPPAPEPPTDPEPPAPEPPTDPEPPSGEFPDEDSTGVPDGVTLTPSGGLTVTQDGAVIDGLHVSGTITIDADNVTIRNTLVETPTSLYPIRVLGGTTGALIENVEIDNMGGTGLGIFFSGSGTVRGANIHSAEDGIRIQSDDVTVEDSYIHDLQRQPGGHHDSIQIRSGDDVMIRGNNLQAYVASTGDPMNAALQLGSLSGTDEVTNLQVVGNLMNGGNYTINAGRGMVDSGRYADNRFQRDFRYGVVTSLDPSEVWEGSNVWHDTGEPVRP